MNDKVILSKNITPTTKRIGIICMSTIAVTAIIGVLVGKMTVNEAGLFVLPVLTSISALIDGGK